MPAVFALVLAIVEISIALVTVAIELIALLVGGFLEYRSGEKAKSYSEILKEKRRERKAERARIHTEKKRKKGEKPAEAAAQAAPEVAPVLPRPWFKWLTLACGGFILLCFVVVVAIDLFFFDSIVRYMLTRTEAKTGIEFVAPDISGSALTGRVEFRDLGVTRPEDRVSTFTFQVAEARADFELLGLLKGARNFDVYLRGVEGSYSKVGNRSKNKSIPRYTLEHLVIEESEILFENARNPAKPPLRLPLTIHRLESRPMRSRYALFDLIFRTGMDAEIEGAALRVETRAVGDGRETTWSLEGAPIALLTERLDNPLQYLNEGTFDVTIDDYWQLGRDVVVDTQWHITFHNLGMNVVPDEVDGRMARAALTTLEKFIEKNPDRLDFEFSIALNEEQFEYALDLDAVGLWRSVGEALLEEFKEAASEKKDALIDAGKERLGKLKGLFGRDEKEEAEE